MSRPQVAVPHCRPMHLPVEECGEQRLQAHVHVKLWNRPYQTAYG